MWLLSLALLACGVAALGARRWAPAWLLAGLAAVVGATAWTQGFQAAPAAAALAAFVLAALRSLRLPEPADATSVQTVPDVPLGRARDGGVSLSVVVVLVVAAVMLWQWSGSLWGRVLGGVAAAVGTVAALGFVLRPVATVLLAAALAWAGSVLLPGLRGQGVPSVVGAAWLAGWAAVGFRRTPMVAVSGAWTALVAAVAAVPMRGMAAQLLGWAVLLGLPLLHLGISLVAVRRLALESDEEAS